MMRILNNFSLTKKNLLVTIILCIVLVLALFVRFYQLSSIPSGFHIDEASLGYNAYSLLLTGKDSDGNKLPLYISMFNDNNPTGYYYMAAASIKFFGLSEFATRFPAALFGSLSVLAVFLLGFVIFRDKKIALLGALLTAIAPWNVVLSRTSAETLVALFFTVLGFALVILSFRGKNISWLLLGTMSLFASLFIYPAPRVFVPLFFLLLAIFYFANWFKDSSIRYRVSIIGSFLFLVLSSIILVFFVAGGTARFSQVSIFSFPATKLIMAEQIKEDGVMGTGATTTRLFHNKIVNYSLTFASNYFQYFTGDFLFIKGGLPLILRVPNVGLVLILELPFLLWGIISMVKNKNKFSKIILLWLLIAPVASALTVDDSPNVRRALVMFPVIELLAAYGFFMFIDNFKKNKQIIFSVVLGALLLLNSIYFMHQYFVHAQIDKNWYRNVGYKEMVAEVETNYSNYDSVVVTKSFGGIAPLILFYTKYNPVTYQNEGSPKDKSFSGFGKFFFADAFCPFLDRDVRFPKVKKTIYVDNGNCRDDSKLSGHKVVNIFGKDGVKIFRIVYE